MGTTSVTGKRKKSQDINNDSLQIDDYDLSWIEDIEKSFTFVWCDASIGTQSKADDDKNTIMHIAHIVNKNRQLLHTFNEIKACRDFITHVNNVCLIISGSLGEKLVPLIHNLEQIHSIYIFCINKPKNELWASRYEKIRGEFTDITAICESLKAYVISRSTADYDRIEFDLIGNEINIPTMDKHQLCLTYSKLSKIILLNMDSSDHGKQDMINYCRNEYTTEYQIQLINDIEQNYSQYNSIWWYTKNGFFQGIIKRALRAHDLYALCSMYRFIKDMDLKLLQLYNQQKSSTEPLNLYFGQILLRSDLDRLKDNLGELICINEFLSANPEQGIALMFIKQQDSSSLSGNKVRVLFQIHIDQSIESNVAYAQIGSISQFVHEKEYLISMSSIYRIEKLTNISSAYFVKLTLIPQNDLQYNNLTQYIQQEEINLVELGYTIKNCLHQFKSANKLFKQVLCNQKQEFRAIILHYNMAIIYHALGKCEKSLEEYRCALIIARNCIPTCYQKDDLCLVPLYSNMALTYEQDNKFANALEHAFRALSITSKLQVNSILKNEFESGCCYNLGSIHEQEKKFSEARTFYEQTLKIRQEYLLLGHPDVTILQNFITLLSTKQNNSRW